MEDSIWQTMRENQALKKENQEMKIKIEELKAEVERLKEIEYMYDELCR